MKEFDLTIIGGGPGGYTAAIRASQLGFKTAIIEKDKLGGVCLNWGCIPTKALLKNAELMNSLKRAGEFGVSVENVSFDFNKVVARSRKVAEMSAKGVQYLMKKNKIDLFEGLGTFENNKSISVLDYSGNEIERLQSRFTIVATGARARTIGNIRFDEDKILSSTGAMLLKEVPEKMTIVGSGAIGMEFAYFYNAFGTDVTIIEMLPGLLPIEDTEISNVVAREFRKKGIKTFVDTKTEDVQLKVSGVITKVTGKENKEIESDVVLIAVGVRGNIENMGLEDIGVELFKNGIKVDKNYKTNVEGIYAIGDVALIDPKGKPWLAHVASAEAVNCVEKMKSLHTRDIDYENIPGCTYCQPQVASVGLTEEEAVSKGYELRIGKFPFTANGKSRAMGETAGMVKLIFNKKNDELLGGHIVGAEATELINELAVIKSLHGTGESIIQTIHAHPTLSESIMEAAGVAYGEAINI
jgi:dihydrolipoamide dehydrogenase